MIQEIPVERLCDKLIQTDYTEEYDLFRPKCEIPLDRSRRNSNYHTQWSPQVTQSSRIAIQLFSKQYLDKANENKHKYQFSCIEGEYKRSFLSSKDRTNKLRELINSSQYQSNLRAIKSKCPGPGTYNVALPFSLPKSLSNSKNNKSCTRKKFNGSKPNFSELSKVLSSRMLQGSKNVQRMTNHSNNQDTNSNSNFLGNTTMRKKQLKKNSYGYFRKSLQANPSSNLHADSFMLPQINRETKTTKETDHE